MQVNSLSVWYAVNSAMAALNIYFGNYGAAFFGASVGLYLLMVLNRH